MFPLHFLLDCHLNRRCGSWAVAAAIACCISLVVFEATFAQEKSLASIYKDVLSRRQATPPFSEEVATEILIDVASECFQPANQVSITEQEQVIELLAQAWSERLRSANTMKPAAEGKEFLRRALTELEVAAEKGGVPSDIAGLGRYYLVQFYYDQQMLVDFHEAIRDPRLEQAINSCFDRFAKSTLPFRPTARLYANYREFRGRGFAKESDYLSAFGNYDQALDVWRAIAHIPGEIDTLNNLADLHLNLGDPASAKRLLEKAVKLQPDDDVMEGDSGFHSQLMLAHCMSHSESVKHLKKLRSRVQLAKANGKLKVGNATLCDNELAIALYGNGDFEQCESLFRSVLVERTKNFAAPRLMAETEVNLGWVCMATDKTTEAIERFTSALKTFQQIKQRERTSEVLCYLARAIVQRDPTAARERIQEALQLETAYMLDVLSTALSDRSRLAFLQNQRIHTESPSWPGELDTYLELAETLEIPVRDRYQQVLRWKGVLSRNRPRDEGSATATHQSLRNRYIETRRKLFEQRKQQRSAESIQVVADLELQFNQIERELRRLARNVDSPDTRFTVEDLQSVLAGEEALLDIIEYQTFVKRKNGEPMDHSNRETSGRRYCGFLVTNDSIEWLDLGTAKKIEDDLGDYIELLAAPGVDRPERDRLAIDISEQILDPILKASGKIKTLIIAPDGLFNQLAWNSLPSTQPEHDYLGQALTVYQFASADLFVASRRRSSTTAKDYVLFGDVDYGEDGVWARLKSTGKEVDQLQRRLRKYKGKLSGSVFKDKLATKGVALQQLSQRSVVHFATHGAFLEDEAEQRSGFTVLSTNHLLDSSLVFAGANEDETGFESILTSEEIRNMDLRHVKLLVLSACETGLGHNRAGQGCAGLTGAFHQAGVEATVATLWEIPDEASQLLMGYFYQHLLDNGEPFQVANSLAYAQETLRTNHPNFRDPWFWAAWIVVGE